MSLLPATAYGRLEQPTLTLSLYLNGKLSPDLNDTSIWGVGEDEYSPYGYFWGLTLGYACGWVGT